jgi:hypothetical protein
MENFITGHLLGKNVDVYCGCDDKFKGTVIACADGVLTLETKKGLYTHIAINKIIAVWAGYEEGETHKLAAHKKPKKTMK